MTDISAWIAEHGDDPIIIRLIDLVSVVARIEQAAAEEGIAANGLISHRLVSCDLPRLYDYLPVAAKVDLAKMM